MHLQGTSLLSFRWWLTLYPVLCQRGASEPKRKGSVGVRDGAAATRGGVVVGQKSHIEPSPLLGASLQEPKAET